MRGRETSTIVLVSAQEDFVTKLRDAVANTDIALLHAQTHSQAIALLETLKFEIALAVIEIELPDLSGWDLVRQLTRPERKALKLIATTSLCRKQFLEKLKELDVEAVVPKAAPEEEWRKTVEAVLLEGDRSAFPIEYSEFAEGSSGKASTM